MSLQAGSPLPAEAASYGLALPKNNGMAKPVLDALKQVAANRVGC